MKRSVFIQFIQNNKKSLFCLPSKYFPDKSYSKIFEVLQKFEIQKQFITAMLYDQIQKKLKIYFKSVKIYTMKR